MDFGALPPEVNSARMHSGAGSAPMVSAASAWSWLAAELRSAADGYDSVITRLASEEWVGPASAHMAAAATPYVEWMRMTALQAEQAASHARSAAAAFENAFAMTVPPAAVVANRSQVESLAATNVLGQNTPAIAAAQAHYGEMWAQDAAAMYGYAGQSATAAEVTPFAPPPQTTNPAGEAGQAAATAQAAGTGADSTSRMITSMPKALQGLASPVAGEAAAGEGLYDGYLGLWNDYGTVISPIQNTFATPYRLVGTINSLQSLGKAWAPAAAKAATDGAKAAAGAAGAAGLGGLGGLGGGQVSAGLGAAAQAGKLAVPPAWVSAAPALSPGAAPLPISGISAAAAPQAGGAGNLLGGMPLAGAAAGGGGAAPRYGFRPTVMMRPPFAG